MNTDKKYRVKDASIISAIQMNGMGVIETKLGAGTDSSNKPYPQSESYSPGDWVVTTNNGCRRVWSDEEFHKAYEEVK